MAAFRSFQWGARKDVGLLAMAGDLCLLGEKLNEVGNFAVPAGFESFLNATDRRAEFGGAFSIEFLNLIRLFRNDVVGAVAIEFDLVEAGAVVEIAEAHKADFLKSGETAVDGDKIARICGEIAVDLLNAGGLRSLDECFEDRDARLGDS